MSADLLQSQGGKSEKKSGKKSRKKSGKKLKGEKKVETEKIERKIWMALTGLRTFVTLFSHAAAFWRPLRDIQKTAARETIVTWERNA